MSEISSTLSALTSDARNAYRALSLSNHDSRNMALKQAARHLREMREMILEANATDMQAAADKGLSGAMLDRLKLDIPRVEAMATGLETIASQPDPLDADSESWSRPNGLTIQKRPVPLGVIGVIYESRPNVTADAAGLCIKSGNAVLLRGGSESFHSSQAIAKTIHAGLEAAELPAKAVQLIPTTERRWVHAMLHAHGEIDVLIPRGGKGLTALVAKESRVPTLLHLDGNCHSYIHGQADSDKAIAVITNAKMRRTGICGATESVLIDASIAAQILPPLCNSLMGAGVKEIRGCSGSQTLDSRIVAASEEDWETEYLDSKLSVKIVNDIDAAIAHINRYGSHHTDAIFTEDAKAAQQFIQQIDSAIVMHNTSTQFADGGEFGMGAEIGIATGRLHARGPVGAAQLTTYKYAVTSDGAIRA